MSDPTSPGADKPVGDQQDKPPVTFLGKANDTLTAIAATVGTIGTIIATIAANLASGAKDEAKDASGKTTELKATVDDIRARQIALDDNYRYVEFFLKYMAPVESGDKGQQGSPATTPPAASGAAAPADGTAGQAAIKPADRKNSRESEMAARLAALSVIAHANTSAGGNSPAETRGALPICVALMEGKHGAVAAMDPNLAFVKSWIVFAEASEDPLIRLTAIKAIAIICRIAARDENGPCLLKGMGMMERLILLYDPGALDKASDTLINIDQFIVQGQALVVQSELFNYLERSRGYQKLRKSMASRDHEDLDKLRDSVAEQLAKNTVAADKQRASLAWGGVDTGASAVDAVADLEKRKEALKEASQSTGSAVAQMAQAPPSALAAAQEVPETASTLPTAPTEEQRKASIIDLIAKLPDENETVRHKVRADLALYRQDAIEPLANKLDELNKLGAPDNNDTYKTKLGIALALSKMQQPVVLTSAQLQAVMPLLGAADRDSRSATLDFLINLESQSTLHAAFDALVSAVVPVLKKASGEITGQDERLVINAVTVMGGWGTALNKTLSGVTPSTPGITAPVLKELSEKDPLRKQAIEAIDKLAVLAAKEPKWNKARDRITYMSQRAKAFQDAAEKKEAEEERTRPAAAQAAQPAAAPPAVVPPVTPPPLPPR
ncbi:hypothetical protein [Luteolibacter sp. Populi]|uniref:hypothetical protein n=1 Tax=Luteolibacter sp. Populi TaxID=3230487 RepID=UPI0034679D39